ncbi:MAG: hypothetical protein FJ145_19770 [Deltaproteobacteria bacterium]|nr:hypothetical protein [Deltaproteobacteria bacterium]
MSAALPIHYEPKLVEEAVFQAGYTSAPAQLNIARDRLYEIADGEQRERAFQALYRTWFAKLGLSLTIEKALQEQPLIAESVGACFVVYAAHAKQEGAELYVKDERRTLRLALRPAALRNADALQSFLRKELFHIADMLDPAFGYEPTLPKSPDGPTYDNFITHRYRALWNITITGRIARRGWLAPTAREEALNEFIAAFPMLQENGEKLFSRFYDSDHPRHAELTPLAFDPAATVDGSRPHSAQATHCPLCKFPTYAFEPAPQNLGADTQAEITADFPDWSPEKGLCNQCADLYRGRRMSLAALKMLPGWHSPTV